jgi:predicted GNAT family acetyltransferase
MDKNQLPVMHAPERNRFEIHAQGETAVLDYMLDGSTIIFTHTGVPSSLEGQGLGSKLANAGLEYARANALQIKSLCWFVTRTLEHHPEYQT